MSLKLFVRMSLTYIKNPKNETLKLYSRAIDRYRQQCEEKDLQKTKKLKAKVADSITLDSFQEQLIMGSTLGDMSLKHNPRNDKNARACFKHSETQKDWFLWKARMLRNLCGKKAIMRIKSDGFSHKRKLVLQTRHLRCLTRFHSKMFTNNSLDFKKPWLYQITPFGLMVWFLDDGSRHGAGNRKGHISTEGWGWFGVKELRKMLWSMYGIKTTKGLRISHINGKRYWTIGLSQLELRKF